MPFPVLSMKSSKLYKELIKRLLGLIVLALFLGFAIVQLSPDGRSENSLLTAFVVILFGIYVIVSGLIWILADLVWPCSRIEGKVLKKTMGLDIINFDFCWRCYEFLFDLSPDEETSFAKKIKVYKDQYNSVDEGDIISIHYHPKSDVVEKVERIRKTPDSEDQKVIALGPDLFSQ
jgi:hypothetical protein